MSREATVQTQQTPTCHPLSQGNILQRKCSSCGQHKAGGGICANCQSKNGAKPLQTLPSIQTKLTVGRPNDKYEQEADRVAEQIMRMPVATTIGNVGSQFRPPTIQRMCATCDEGEKLQTKGGSGSTPEVTPAIASRIHSLQSGGKPLPISARHFFEPRFGQDFSHIRVHTDARSTQVLNAKAYTVGKTIVFGAGEYAPETISGKQLLAHELTHTVQQGSGVKNNSANSSVQRTIGDGHDLTAARFSGNVILEAVFDNERLIRRGHRGTPVRLIQESLLAQNYALPHFGADGIFGGETEAAIRQFQIDAGAVLLDGIVGPETMGLLDSHDPGLTTGTLGLGPAPPAIFAFTFESLVEPFAGYDASTFPDSLVVPVDGRRRVAMITVPNNSNPAIVSLNPAVASVEPLSDGFVVTGVSDGSTRIEVREGARMLDRIDVEVKTRRDVTVDYHFMRDTAAPPAPQHRTARSPGDAPTLTATLNRIWERQANIRFRTGIVDSPQIPTNLGGQVLWTAGPVSEWNTVTAFRTAGNWNVFLVWEYEQDATPLVDNVNAGTLGSDTLLEDSECIDTLTIAHEAGHFLRGDRNHAQRGIMSGCPGNTRRRVPKSDADVANP